LKIVARNAADVSVWVDLDVARLLLVRALASGSPQWLAKSRRMAVV